MLGVMSENQFPVLYSRTAKGAVNVWRAWPEEGRVFQEWGQQGGKMQVQSFACEPKNVGKKNATTAQEQATKETQALYTKKRKAKYNDSLESAGETKRIKPMLAQDFLKLKKPVQFPVVVQPKLDGVRCLAYRVDGRVVLQSRGGDFYDVEHIRGNLEKWLPEGVILDGELYLHGTSLQSIVKLVKTPQERSTWLEYVVYDTAVELPYSARRQMVSDVLNGSYARYNTHVRQIGELHCDCTGDITLAHQQYVSQGFEGAIIRTLTGTYREGYRSPDLLKLKTWQDAEFRIVGWETGKGKFENVVTFECETKEGKTFKCTPKGTEEERLAMLKEAQKGNLLGQYLTVKYFDLTEDGIPHFPVGLTIRGKEDM